MLVAIVGACVSSCRKVKKQEDEESEMQTMGGNGVITVESGGGSKQTVV